MLRAAQDVPFWRPASPVSYEMTDGASKAVLDNSARGLVLEMKPRYVTPCMFSDPNTPVATRPVDAEA